MIDVQCVMPSLANVAKCFHTRLVSTSEIAHSPATEQFTFDVERGYAQAAHLIQIAAALGARVLVTTRYADWGGQAAEVKLDVLGGDAAAAFLQKRDPEWKLSKTKDMPEELHE